jgi:hypothetical protein
VNDHAAAALLLLLLLLLLCLVVPEQCRRAFAQQLKLQDRDAACYNAAIAHAARDMPCISALEMQCNRCVDQWAAVLLVLV